LFGSSDAALFTQTLPYLSIINASHCIERTEYQQQNQRWFIKQLNDYSGMGQQRTVTEYQQLFYNNQVTDHSTQHNHINRISTDIKQESEDEIEDC